MQESLEELLARLKGEIERIEHGEGDRDKLSRLARQVEDRVNTTANEREAGHHEGLVHELEDGVRRFEVTHPELARVIGQIANALSAIGL